ncbi:methyltransferase [Desulfotignum phosphitoxidans]|uniref:Tetracenomycin polyketide synthesis 8-O-methyl transferase TcmO n=1 Tax=Desulfotignum phosphitoxidans DSM 13687 TaxID=1286635 RepID=S0FV41_9BACT|nr:methyltransferase [Desulfotignum phosphitoxidans]EMS78968.1 tetracenomycin polyketide synthesis 8-O-methyl transferase TcmO [Desulfotignum phosphitoxidans DSM 13687]
MTHTTDWHPGTLLELSGYYWKTCTLHAAVKLDIFTLIGNDILTAREIAQKTGWDDRGTTMLLDALAAMALLTRTASGYANTPAANRFLSKDSDQYIGYMILHHHHLADSWVRMDEAVTQGGPVREQSSISSDQWREAFLMGMFNNAMATAPDVAQSVDLSGCNRLLDMGGGPGTYAIHFCRANPDLTAVVFDLATTRPFAEKTIARFGLSDRIQFAEGDYTTGDVPLAQVFDAAWLSHVLHGEGPEKAAEIVTHAAKALVSGGQMLIHDFILTDTRDRPEFAALFSLNMLLGTESGQSYSESEIREMMTAAGLTNITLLDFTGPTQSRILKGMKS